MLARIRALLPQALLSDRGYARQRLDRLQKRSSRLPQGNILRELAELAEKLDASAALRKGRARRVPRVSFPRELPITAHAEAIIQAVQAHPVIIISGETGSGKSTQIPKMCLSAGRGIGGKIACTQPRRIAAITIAHRIAFELGENLGRSVGYKIRFRDKSAPENFIKIVTDGMLLAESQSDAQLLEYDTLIIDEAHERSLNIDFLLGIARTLLDVRPELKLIITSATLDTEKFVRAFRNAPVIEVSGRQYPVEVEYRPAESFSARADEQDHVELAVKAVELIKRHKHPGDILVFMPTEQDILETCEKLAGRRYAATTILPLFARLPGTQQGKVYHVKGAKIVVATNVAETSLTIPGIRYVVDTGLARIAQYQPGTRINSLPVSPIARSSADQRKGRCGRVRDGVCIRLYTEKDYLSRPAFTPPEILRSNLAEVILRMIDLRLGHPAEFAFVDRPKSHHIKDGYDTLVELGAIRRRGRDHALTEKGRLMARMPLDPKISRMLLEARSEGCLREVAVIAAALSIRDPRERPPDESERADAEHESFRHPDSDFLTLLNIWDRYHGSDADLTSRRRQRRFCRDHFLSFSRVREWMQVHDQIQAIFREQRIPWGRRERVEIGRDLYAGIHRSILSGYLSHIAVRKEKNFYTAAKGRDVMVFPGSTLFGKARPWIVAAEMVRTSRLFARTAARIEPGWLEDLGGDLCRTTYWGARWDSGRDQVVAEERVTLFGLEIVSGRWVSYARVRPEEAHDVFVRSALVEGDLKDPPGFLQHNLALIGRLSQTEEKLRRRGFLAGEDILAEFYSRRLPGIADTASLRRIVRDRGGDAFLRMREADVLSSIPDADELAAFPDRWRIGDLDLPVTYRFAPGEADDGVTLKVPVSQIHAVPQAALEWGVPGQFREWITALVKGLPKRFRKLLVPVAEKVEIIVCELEPGDDSLYATLARFVKRRFGADIPASAWAEAEVPAHLRWRISVVGPDERELGASRDLPALKQKNWSARVPAASEKWTHARRQWERRGLTDWDFDILPETILIGPFVNAFPGLVPGKEGVDIRLFASRQEALDAHRQGVKALLLGRFKKDFTFLQPYLRLPEEYEPLALYCGGRSYLEKSMIMLLHRELLERNLRSRVEFRDYAEGLTRGLFEKSHVLKEAVQRILSAAHGVRMVLSDIARVRGANRAAQEIVQEIRKELDALVPKDFLTEYSLERLGHIPRYLDALRVRAERGAQDPAKDRKKSAAAAPFVERLRSLRQELGAEAGTEKRKAVLRFRWMVEEYKVSLYAPELKTAGPISAQRLTAQLREIESLASKNG